MSDITVQFCCSKWRDHVPGVEAAAVQAAKACLLLAGSKCSSAPVPDGAELTLVLADAAHMRQLNRDYRGQDKATNVLSFNAPVLLPGAPAASSPVYWGDVILCHETIVEEARAQGKSITDHLSHLVVHGILHLMGYDHDTQQRADEMEALEVRILQHLDIADPYTMGDGAPDTRQNRGATSGALHG